MNLKDLPPDLKAIMEITRAIRPLNESEKLRVFDYVQNKFSIEQENKKLIEAKESESVPVNPL